MPLQLNWNYHIVEHQNPYNAQTEVIRSLTKQGRRVNTRVVTLDVRPPEPEGNAKAQLVKIEILSGCPKNPGNYSEIETSEFQV
jgi:hypothetical protein